MRDCFLVLLTPTEIGVEKAMPSSREDFRTG